MSGVSFLFYFCPSDIKCKAIKQPVHQWHVEASTPKPWRWVAAGWFLCLAQSMAHQGINIIAAMLGDCRLIPFFVSGVALQVLWLISFLPWVKWSTSTEHWGINAKRFFSFIFAPGEAMFLFYFIFAPGEAINIDSTSKTMLGGCRLILFSGTLPAGFSFLISFFCPRWSDQHWHINAKAVMLGGYRLILFFYQTGKKPKWQSTCVLAALRLPCNAGVAACLLLFHFFLHFMIQFWSTRGKTK